jgi:superfamily II helicase
MKIQQLGPQAAFEFTATCINCGHRTFYSEMTRQEYLAMQMTQSLCDKCALEERERILKETAGRG